ncbi:hypothetical protein FRC08_007160 [Ceratobasidium sp. 394]|nr:hypothetical protein FRC08_007160 [Ceratobasidium sp. 394]
MKLLQYPVSNPYPGQWKFVIALVVLILLLLPFLVLINIVTTGYELVPALRMDFKPNDTIPEWMNTPYLPPLLRRKAPGCQPKDIGRGDIIRLTPSLFQYKVLSAWRDAAARDPGDETRIEYRGGSFKSCYIYGARFEHSLVDWTQSVTAAIYCPQTPVNVFLETTIVVADDINKDIVGDYYGEYTSLFKFIDMSSRNYRKAVFAILDAISTDSLMIISGQHLSAPLLSLSVSLNVSKNYEPSRTYITYVNGSVDAYYDSSMGRAQIYRDTIYNLVAATVHAVNLDLGNAGPNIFLNPSMVHDTFVPNLPPPGVSPENWVRDSESFYYGTLEPPYQTWAQMILAGRPQNLTLGNLTGLPPDSKMHIHWDGYDVPISLGCVDLCDRASRKKDEKTFAPLVTMIMQIIAITIPTATDQPIQSLSLERRAPARFAQVWAKTRAVAMKMKLQSGLSRENP